MSIKDAINHFFRKAPEQQELSDNIDDLSKRLEKANNGVYLDPFDKETPFDVTSERGKIYIETLATELKNAQQQYEHFFPSEKPQDVRTDVDAECGMPLQELSK